MNKIQIGILQGRLTPSVDGSLQFFPKDNWQNEFAVAKQLGFDCIEWLIKNDEMRERNPFFVPFGLKEVESLVQKSGISIPSIHAFYSKGSEYSWDLTDIALKAKQISVRTILVSFFGENALKTKSDKELALRKIREVLGFCGALGIRIAIESEMEAAELLEFINSFASPIVGVYYDIGNMASMGVDVAAEITFLSNKIFGVHIKDRKACGGETVPLGLGCVDFEKAFRALHDVYYAGPFIIQSARIPGVDDVQLNLEYLRFCKRLLQRAYKEAN